MQLLLELLGNIIMYYAVYQTASGELSWCRIPANITVFAGAFRYASRMATSSDKLVAVVPLSVLQSWNLVKPVLLSTE